VNSPRPAAASIADSTVAQRSIPAARPIDQFCTEWIADNVVLFDAELNRYHTLNRPAFDIWRLCDGVRTVDLIAVEASSHRTAVESAIEQLGEAGLLEAPELSFESTVSRRKMLKLASAGVVGAVALPLVESITVPYAASAASGDECVPGVLDCPKDNNGNAQCCCLNGSGKKYVCRACPCP
jgi:hypothetical protein